MVTKIGRIPKWSVFQQILSGPSQVWYLFKATWTSLRSTLRSALCNKCVTYIYVCHFSFRKKMVIKIMSLVLSLWQLIHFWVFVRVNFQKHQEVRLYIKCSVNFMQFFMLDICFLLLFTNITKEFLSKFIFKCQV